MTTILIQDLQRRDTQREDCEDGERGGTSLAQAKECLEPPAAGRAKKDPFLQASRGAWPY